MKINDVIQEAVLSEAPPTVAPQNRNVGQLAQRSQQRNVAPQPAQPNLTPVQSVPPQQSVQSKSTNKFGNFIQGITQGLGFSNTAQAMNNYNTSQSSETSPSADTSGFDPVTGEPVGATSTTANTQQMTPATPSAKPSGNDMAQKLATDWRAFTQAGGNAGPALKQQIKQMWLDAGGVRAESKKNKKRPI